MVNVRLVERILADIKSNTEALRQADDISWEVYQHDIRNRRFVERSLHIMTEAVIDIGQHIISDNKLREPDSYRDTFVVLAENGIIDKVSLPVYEKMAAFRNLIVHYYERIDDEIVFGIFQRNLGDFDKFVKEITNYLRCEQ